MVQRARVLENTSGVFPERSYDLQQDRCVPCRHYLLVDLALWRGVDDVRIDTTNFKSQVGTPAATP